MANSNYGIVLKKGNGATPELFSTIGEITKLSLPKISTEKIESTHAESGGKRTFIPSGLIGMDDFSVTINVSAEGLAELYGDMKAKRVPNYKFVFPADSNMDDWEISGFALSIEPEEVDQVSPGVFSAVVTFAVANFNSFEID